MCSNCSCCHILARLTPPELMNRKDAKQPGLLSKPTALSQVKTARNHRYHPGLELGRKPNLFTYAGEIIENTAHTLASEEVDVFIVGHNMRVPPSTRKVGSGCHVQSAVTYPSVVPIAGALFSRSAHPSLSCFANSERNEQRVPIDAKMLNIACNTM